jgi:hypothetical protein
MDKEDKDRAFRDEQRNSLEQTVYASRDFLSTPDSETVSKKEEREAIQVLLKENSEFLDYEGDSATTQVLTEKLSLLKEKVGTIKNRLKELKQRPSAVQQVEKLIKKARETFDKYENEDKENPLVTPLEKTGYTNALDSIEAWIKTKTEEQEKLPMDVDPILKLAELDAKKKEIQGEINQLEFKVNNRKRERAIAAAEAAKAAKAAASKSSSTTIAASNTTVADATSSTQTSTASPVVDKEKDEL